MIPSKAPCTAAFVASSGRYSAIYSSFAVLILFLIWLYVGWLIVLAGAQVAYYHQHPSAYLFHLRQKQQTPLFREYLTLALLGHITRRFIAGKAPLKDEQLARVQRVPLTLIDSLTNDLIQANMLVRTERPKGVALARPPENIAVADVLKVVQHQLHNGPQGFTVGTDKISQLLMRRDAAVQGALEGITLKHLVKDQPIDPLSDEKWEMSSKEESDLFESSEPVDSLSLDPLGLPRNVPSNLSSTEKWRSS